MESLKIISQIYLPKFLRQDRSVNASYIRLYDILQAVLKTSQIEDDLGVFSNSSILIDPLSSSSLTYSPTGLKLNETSLTNNLGLNTPYQLLGVATNATNMGSFSGSLLTSNSTVKDLLQQLETAFESITPPSTNLTRTLNSDSIDIFSSTGTDINIPQASSSLAGVMSSDSFNNVANLITLTGVPSNSLNLGTFPASIISDSSSIKAALSQLEAFCTTLRSDFDSRTTLTASPLTGNGTTTAITLTDGTTTNETLRWNGTDWVHSIPNDAIYVSEKYGNDSNLGTREAPLKTLSAAKTALIENRVPNKLILLQGGNTWKESLNTLDTSSLYGTKVDCYDCNNSLPIVDGADPCLTSWTQVGSTKAYTKNLIPDNGTALDKGHVTVFEDGTPLIRVASAATVETTPGSYYAGATLLDGTPAWNTGVTSIPVTIHTRYSEDPNIISSRNALTWTKRSYGIQLGGGSISNVIGKNAAVKDGALLVVGDPSPDGSIFSCTSSNNTYHNFLFQDIIDSCNSLDLVFSNSSEHAHIVAFQPSMLNVTPVFRNLNIIQNKPYSAATYSNSVNAIVVHSSASSTDPLGATIENINVYNCHNVVNIRSQSGLSSPATATVTNWYAYNCNQLHMDGPVHYIFRNGYFKGTEKITGTYSRNSEKLSYIDNAFYTPNVLSTNPFLNILSPGTLEVLGNTVYTTGKRFMTIGGSGSTTTSAIQKNIFFANSLSTSNSYNFYHTTSASALHHSNLFYTGNSNQIQVRVGSTQYTTLADAQAVGMELNSAYLSTVQAQNFFLSGINGPLYGDFRINPAAECTWADGTISSSLPDGTPLTSLGKSNPWSAWKDIPLANISPVERTPPSLDRISPNRVTYSAAQTFSTSTHTNLTGLAFPVVAGKKYKFKLYVGYLLDNSATDFGVGFTAPSGMVSDIEVLNTTLSNYGARVDLQVGLVGSYAPDTLALAGSITSPNNGFILEGEIYSVPSSGTVQFTARRGDTGTATVSNSNTLLRYQEVI